MCLLPGEGLLYCFFPFFFHLTVLIVSLVCEFQRQSQAGSVAAEIAIHQDSRQLAGLSWPAQIFFGVLVLDVLVLITATYVHSSSFIGTAT